MAKTHIALLVNSVAGKGKALQVCQIIENELTKSNIYFTTYQNNWCATLDGYTEAWVVGGDGTLNFFLNKYPNCSIPIAIFKGGTGNDVAWKLYGDITTQKQIQKVLSGTAQRTDAGLCNGKIFMNGVGIGFDGEVLQSINAIRYIGGHLGYLLVVIKIIFSFHEYSVSIAVDGKTIAKKFLLLMVFNSSRTGGGFYVAPNAMLNDGLLNMVLCNAVYLL
jgi:diacylglycerol kinase (ATP)